MRRCFTISLYARLNRGGDSRIPSNQRNMVQQPTQTICHTKDFHSQGEVGARSSKRLMQYGSIYGFPISSPRGGIGVPQSRREFSALPHSQGAITNTVSYLGIAADEPLRIEKHKDKAIMPLTIIGWDEAYCWQWCEDNLLLAPTYSDSLRGGCWFCHNQSVGQLRLLRKKYPEYWQLLLKWDNDSPVTFKPDGHTVHDFEKRFAAEDKGLIVPGDSRFRWKQVL